MKRLSLILIAVLCSLEGGCKKELGEIYGFVMDVRTADPIEGARVSLYRCDEDGTGGIFKSIETENNGSFHFNDIETTYRGFWGKTNYDFDIIATAPGYKDRRVSISVISNIVNRIDVELTPIK